MALFWEMLAVQLNISQVNQTISQKSRLWTPKWSILNFKYIFVVIIHHFRGLRVSDFDTLLMMFFISLLQNTSHHWVYIFVRGGKEKNWEPTWYIYFKVTKKLYFCIWVSPYFSNSKKKKRKKHAMWSQKYSS